MHGTMLAVLGIKTQTSSYPITIGQHVVRRDDALRLHQYQYLLESAQRILTFHNVTKSVSANCAKVIQNVVPTIT